ncbi:hypothetical protein [uncultured Campylobacter sp.]|uniref:hypothetical protein n=1 Tax=uncultured Campylobacter sp. TaxID=218934 RepID=UPI00260E38E3|nr:hypothetical protein [uncultured Campylobacter sp.]
MKTLKFVLRKVFKCITIIPIASIKTMLLLPFLDNTLAFRKQNKPIAKKIMVKNSRKMFFFLLVKISMATILFLNGFLV